MTACPRSNGVPAVLQLIPAAGWWVHYRDGDPEPVQCFALVEHSDPEPWRAVLSVVPSQGALEFAEDASNFVGLEYRGGGSDAPGAVAMTARPRSDGVPAVLQLVPAAGWWVHYRDGDPEPVQCFALVEHSDPEPWRAVLSVVPSQGALEFAEDASNFVGLEYRGGGSDASGA